MTKQVVWALGARGLGEAFDAVVLAGVSDESFADMLKIERSTGTGTPSVS
jgi:hypothetical protein